MNRLGNGLHASQRQKSADAVFEMRNNLHHRRRLIGIRSVVGREAVEELNRFRVFKPLLVDFVEAQIPANRTESSQGTKDFGRQIGAELVERSFEKERAGLFVERSALIEIGRHGPAIFAQDPGHVGVELIDRGRGDQPGAVVPEVATGLGNRSVAEIGLDVSPRERKKILHEPGHRE